MKLKLDENWTTNNNNYPLNDAEAERYISVVPNENQLRLAKKPFYSFIHFGMNTSTGREWGSATETVDDYTIKKLNVPQWIKTIKASGAMGVILTCKHHDGFCLWDTKQTDFNIMNTVFGQDIVKMVSDECRRQNMDFGVYLSPWDMHEKCYATPAYDDFFCNQLTELLTNYGELFEVWFDGAKGAKAKAFDYDWDRYYKLIRELQPKANIAICGPDIRWVGNEGGKSRKSEFSVVPSVLSKAETVAGKSQQSEQDGAKMQNFKSTDEDLGSRKVLSSNAYLSWYPAEVDVSIRKGWFHSPKSNFSVKSSNKLLDIYLRSVGNNCTLLLNVPPTKKGNIHFLDARSLKNLGKKIKQMTANPVVVEEIGELKPTDDYLEFQFDSPKRLKYFIVSEDITKSQRVERFDLFLKKANGKYKHAYKGTVIGNKKIVKLRGSYTGAIFVVRQSRSTPCIAQIGFYE